jgi:hypothetical protein
MDYGRQHGDDDGADGDGDGGGAALGLRVLGGG